MPRPASRLLLDRPPSTRSSPCQTPAAETFKEDEDARPLLDAWDAAGRPNHLPDTRFPRTAARLCLMWERLLTEGFTSFWV